MSDGELEPISDDELVLLGLDFDTPAVVSTHEALHYYFATAHVMHMLNINAEDVGMGTHQYAHTDQVAIMLKDAEDSDARRTIIDELGDFSLELSEAIASFLHKKGLGNVHFFVFLPCHGGVASYWPRGESGKPELKPW